MATSELDSDCWIASMEFPNEFIANQEAGIDVRHADGMIDAVFFYYLSSDMDPFDGATDVGISSASSLNDVKIKYGEPSYIGKGIQSDLAEFPESVDVHIDYVEKGIGFQFIDDRLAVISVFPPMLEFDYEGFGKNLKDWLIFIRPSQESAKQ